MQQRWVKETKYTLSCWFCFFRVDRAGAQSSHTVMEGEDGKVGTSSVGELVEEVPQPSWTIKQLRDYLRKQGDLLTGRIAELLTRYVHTGLRRLIFFTYTHSRTARDICSTSRALFYKSNPEAPMSKRSTRDAAPVATRTPAPVFPDSGWTQDRSKLPRVTASTILSHLLLTGKQVRTSESHVFIIRKPLDRGHELYFGGYIHNVSVCCVEAEIFIEAKCWATQKKSTKYSLRLVFTDDAKNDSAVLDFAVCVRAVLLVEMVGSALMCLLCYWCLDFGFQFRQPPTRYSNSLSLSPCRGFLAFGSTSSLSGKE